MRTRYAAATALILATALLLAACGGGGGTTPVVAVATPSPGPYMCPQSGTAGTGSLARVDGGAMTARAFSHAPRTSTAATGGTTLLAIKYARATLAASLPQAQAREQAAGATFVRSYDFSNLNATMRVVSVPTASVAATEATLRAQAGVQSVGVTGQRRYPLTTTPYYTNDPYFEGFTALQNTVAGNGPVDTFEVGNYDETSAIPGQWDMHAIGLENAYGYSTGGTGVAPNAGALGSASIKIAIIDTGEDANHPELHSKIAYQKCFITSDVSPYAQSTGNFATDELGHGTDVAGIAADDSGNGLGFTGAGGNAVIYGYRVFPTPDDNCTNENTNDDQCTTQTVDIADAINDAITQHVNIISLSLGGGTCDGAAPNGDNDAAEGAAIQDAISAGIIVVAATGNDANQGATGIDSPACDTGVIAVGATALDDGALTGTTTYTTNVNGASSSHIIEYVPAYSQFGTTVGYGNTAAWGIVAPGGDADLSTELTGPPDDLHWIQQIWTTTPYKATSTDTSFTGTCKSDYPAMSQTGTIDCQTLIEGTSMATPHVAGAAALILAATGGSSSPYQSPAAMKTLLCQTTDDIHDTNEGCGRLNVYRALAHALHDTNSP